jgi:DNA-binding MarR family transcriptional regulator
MPVDFAFNDMTLRLWVLLRQTGILLDRCEEKVFSDVGITSNQYYVLIAVRNLKGTTTLTNIAHWLDRKPNSITTIIDRMEKDELVKRVRVPGDRRSLQIKITDKGQLIFIEATKPAMILIKKMMSCLSDTEMQTLLQLMGKLRTSAYDEMALNNKVETMSIDVAHSVKMLLNEDD